MICFLSAHIKFTMLFTPVRIHYNNEFGTILHEMNDYSSESSNVSTELKETRVFDDKTIVKSEIRKSEKFCSTSDNRMDDCAKGGNLDFGTVMVKRILTSCT